MSRNLLFFCEKVGTYFFSPTWLSLDTINSLCARIQALDNFDIPVYDADEDAGDAGLFFSEVISPTSAISSGPEEDCATEGDVVL